MQTDDLNKSSKIVDISTYILFIVSCFTYSVRYFLKASVLTNIISQR